MQVFFHNIMGKFPRFGAVFLYIPTNRPKNPALRGSRAGESVTASSLFLEGNEGGGGHEESRGAKADGGSAA